MVAVACAVGRLGADGPWLGFAPSLDDRYDLVVTDAARVHRTAATVEDLMSLAIAYFEDSLAEPPEELAATHADIAALVRHAAAAATEPDRAELLAEAVDAIDDGLAADVVVTALSRCLGSGVDPLERLRERAGGAGFGSAAARG